MRFFERLNSPLIAFAVLYGFLALALLSLHRLREHPANLIIDLYSINPAEINRPVNLFNEAALQ